MSSSTTGPFSTAILAKLRQAFTLKGLPFFLFLGGLKDPSTLNEDAEEDAEEPRLTREYTLRVLNLLKIRSPIDGQGVSPQVVALLTDSRPTLGPLFARWQKGMTDVSAIRRIHEILCPIIQAVARDKGVYLTWRTHPGPEAWPIWVPMSATQMKNEQLRDEDPETFARVQQYKKTREEIDAAIEVQIQDRGLTPKKIFMMGRPVLLGVHPDTGEELVFDPDGEILDKDTFITKRKKHLETEKALHRLGDRTTLGDKNIRFVSDETIAALKTQVEMVALTDDKAKQGRLTRIFPVKEMQIFKGLGGDIVRETTRVIVEGRFKGAYLDDMVNVNGRLLEGTAYTLNPSTGRTGQVPTLSDPGQREPYVSVIETTVTRADGSSGKIQKLFVKIPGTRTFTDIRKGLKALSCGAPGAKKGCIPSLTYQPQEKSNAVAFTFEPKDYATILSIVHSMSLSAAAKDLLQAYFADLTRADQATAEKNLGRYSATALGGFKTVRKDPQTGQIKAFDLLTAQKKALAWLDVNGNRGVCALDTGVGKTATAIAVTQKMTRDGFTGRFLYVCPKALKGNYAKEARKFLSDASDLLGRTDVISYREWGIAGKSQKPPRALSRTPFWKDQPWDPIRYEVIFFDEAHELAKVNSLASKAALQIKHPRKILLTASPMEEDPMQAYVLAAIATNKPLMGAGLEAQENRLEMKRFRDRYCETVGGHIVGVKQDPLLKRDLHTWVKSHIHYADKTKIREPYAAVPSITQDTVVCEMPPEVEKVYRGVTQNFQKVLGGLVARYKLKGKSQAGSPNARDPEIDRVFTMSFAPVLALLNKLQNDPTQAVADLRFMVTTGTMRGRNGTHPIPKALIDVLSKIQIPDVDVDVGNPKLETTVEVLINRLKAASHASRSLLFSDDKDFCIEAARFISERIPGRHALALNNEIHIYEGGAPLSTVQYDIDEETLAKLEPDEQQRQVFKDTYGMTISVKLPIKEKAYKRYPLPAREPENPHYKAPHWPQFAFREIIAPDPFVRTCVLYGPSYSHGHNLQEFDTVIHLDRDTWDSEAMKQRTARAWRQGQVNPVTEITVDATYASYPDGKAANEFDLTLDKIRQLVQEVDAEVFDNIIRQAQDLALGAEWLDISHQRASTHHIDRKIADLMTSPYVGRSLVPGE